MPTFFFYIKRFSSWRFFLYKKFSVSVSLASPRSALGPFAFHMWNAFRTLTTTDFQPETARWVLLVRSFFIETFRQNESVWKNLNFGGNIRNLWSEIVGNLLFLLYKMVVLFISNIIQNCVYPYYNQIQCWMIAIFIFFLWKMAKLFFLDLPLKGKVGWVKNMSL